MNVSRILMLVLALSLTACGEEVGFSTAEINAAPAVVAQEAEAEPAAEEVAAPEEVPAPKPPAIKPPVKLPFKLPKLGCH